MPSVKDIDRRWPRVSASATWTTVRDRTAIHDVLYPNPMRLSPLSAAQQHDSPAQGFTGSDERAARRGTASPSPPNFGEFGFTHPCASARRATRFDAWTALATTVHWQMDEVHLSGDDGSREGPAAGPLRNHQGVPVMYRSGQTALVAVIQEAEPMVGAWRSRLDPSAAAGVPAHVSGLSPFLAATQ